MDINEDPTDYDDDNIDINGDPMDYHDEDADLVTGFDRLKHKNIDSIDAN